MSAVLENTIVKKMSADEFEASPFAETHELIHGELFPIMPAEFSTFARKDFRQFADG